MITEQQREARVTGLFSSDTPRIMRGESVQLAMEKLGMVEPEDISGNPRVQLGNLLEPKVLDVWERASGKALVRSPTTMRHPEHQFLGAHLDGWVPAEMVVEAKVYSAYHRESWGEEGSDEVPDDIMWQVQHQMLVCGAREAQVPVAFINEAALVQFLTTGTLPVTTYVVPHSIPLCEAIIAQGSFVWGLIEQGELPPPMNIGDARLIYGRDDGSVVEATSEMREWHDELMAARRKRKAFESVEDAAAEELQRLMGAAAEITSNGTTLATWKTAKPSKRFNEEAFKQQHPDVWKQFVVEVSGSRRFLPKGG